MPATFVEGTARRVFQLTDNDVPADLAGATVELVLKTRAGVSIDTVGDVEVVEEAAAQVGYNPDAGDMTVANSPLSARFKVTKGGKVAFYPNGTPDRWEVVGV